MTSPLNISTIDNSLSYSNARSIDLAILNLYQLIDLRLLFYFEKDQKIGDEEEIQFPMICENQSPFAQFIQKYKPTFDEYIILIMALVPHVKVDFFDEVWNKHIPKSGDFPKIGGVRDVNSRAFSPTIETVLFVLAGEDLEKRFEVQNLFSDDHWLYTQNILISENVKTGDSFSIMRLIMNPEYVELFTIGKVVKPTLSQKFPAQQISTLQEWSDLVLSESTLREINEVKIWIQHSETLMNDWKMKRKLKPGYRALFYGPPGTGKTLTASLLGKYTNREVYRIDLSMIVSKYIGETEKNLSNLFAKAENKNWILFFDEADALFGKRTNTRDAQDKYANQEVAYLLQRVESYNGLVILASNFKSNIDDAFIRRFQSIVHFSMPEPDERLRLWKQAIPPQLKLKDDIDLRDLARKYELSGSNIINIVQYCALQALGKDEDLLGKSELLHGVRRELKKEGKSTV